ncbi:MAG: hypothetical protein ABI467_22845, partial [Kofleriaceae bacterium]
MKRLVIAILSSSCTGTAPPGGNGTIDASSTIGDAPAAQRDAPAGALALTSVTLTNATVLDANTCTGPGNTSPVLAWTGDAKGA